MATAGGRAPRSGGGSQAELPQLPTWGGYGEEVAQPPKTKHYRGAYGARIAIGCGGSGGCGRAGGTHARGGGRTCGGLAGGVAPPLRKIRGASHQRAYVTGFGRGRGAVRQGAGGAVGLRGWLHPPIPHWGWQRPTTRIPWVLGGALGGVASGVGQIGQHPNPTTGGEGGATARVVGVDGSSKSAAPARLQRLALGLGGAGAPCAHRAWLNLGHGEARHCWGGAKAEVGGLSLPQAGGCANQASEGWGGGAGWCKTSGDGGWGGVLE
ncbi:hypothetical protein Tco_0335692 [Tanacetum coccineum]